MRKATPILLVLLVLIGPACSTDSNEPTLTNPYDPSNAAGLPVPEGLWVTVGNNRIQLSWSLPEGESAEEYAVFRKRLDVEPGTLAETRLVAQSSDTTYLDTGVRNGRTYGYTIAAGRDGKFGARSEEVDASPGLYTIVINDDTPKTRLRAVDVSLNGTSDVSAVMLSEDPDFEGAAWQRVAVNLSFTLGPGDGTKTVYAKFQLGDGSESFPVSDAIQLDTQAVIRSFDFEGSSVRSPGDVLHFTLDAGEPDGNATAEVTGLFPALVQLFDDGTNGDRAAQDGVYERDIPIPSGSITQTVVTGRFADDVGNQANAARAPRTLSVQAAPDPVSLLGLETADPPADPAVTIRWSQYLGTDFSAYQVFRAASAPVDSSDRLLGTVTGRITVDYEDSDVIEGHTYAYRIFLLTTSGLSAGSNTVSILVPNQRPPASVQLLTSPETSTDRIALEWTKSSARDFASYRVYRNLTGAVSQSDPLVAEIPDADQVYLDDGGLVENTEYFYRVYVIDEGSLSSRSNEVGVVTRNEPPPAVVLDPVSVVDSTSVRLHWSPSDAHDFAFYRVYRDEIPSVSTSSELVVEIDESGITAFLDTDLEPSARYFYRVFVVDDGTNPEPMSTGSNTVSYLPGQ